MSAAARELRSSPEPSSYGQILKSSALIGGASLLNVLISLARTKALALLLGPAGVGLLGLYGAIFDLAQSVAGCGVSSSGVRQMAEAAGSGNHRRVALTWAALRRTAWFLGLLGAVGVFALAGPVADFTFGDRTHAAGVGLLGLAVLLRVLADSESAALQGLRRIGDLATLNVLGAALGALAAVPLVYWLGEDGVAWSLVAAAALAWLAARRLGRRACLPARRLPSLLLSREQTALLKLGFTFMASGLMVLGSAYLVRILLRHAAGVEAAGLYQAAWALGGLYVGFILQSMGADFYPRLTAVAHDSVACNRLVNEQAEVSLLLAGPGVLATLTLAPLVVGAFYTPEFQGAVGTLRWLCLGMALRIVSWPLGFIILAKGAQGWFFWGETAWTCVYLGLAWICVERFGLDGAGLAFLGSYVFHCLLNYVAARRLSGFAWSAGGLRANWAYLPLIGAVFAGFEVLPPLWGLGLGLAATVVGGVYSLGALLGLAAAGRAPRRLVPLLERLRLAGPAAAEGAPALAGGVSLFALGAWVGVWAYWWAGVYQWN